MDDQAAIVKLLDEDATKAGGYAPPARTIRDREHYRSLQDPAIIRVAVEQAHLKLTESLRHG
jgi:hypothetical protein